MPWFEFNQNNSGGHFDIDPEAGIGPRVWIEADTASEANDRLISLGGYFDGCESGRDCRCCGDRWYPKWSDTSGEESPSISQEYDFKWHDAVYLHDAKGHTRALKKGDVP